jgi:hypothetical protein
VQKLHIERIGVLKFAYPTVWRPSQLLTGPVADRCGRNPLIGWDLVAQALALWLLLRSSTVGGWLASSILLGAMVYPALLAIEKEYLAS